jgi:ABC-type sugar transport system ATPase subunit
MRMQPSSTPVLDVRAVSKHFEGVRALRDVDLSVVPGEIHALLGENGAGKSTLIKILTGVFAPDSGTITLSGNEVSFASVKAANAAGIIALYQELATIPTLTVAENIALGGRAPSTVGVVQWSALKTLARTQLERLGQDIPLDRLAAGLSPVRQTMIALARALAQDAKVLILDEPTAALSATEVEVLFGILEQLRAEGVAIIYVSHRFEEVFALCDRYTVMRNGATVKVGVIADTSEDEIIRSMVGREPDQLYPTRGTAPAEAVLNVEALAGSRVKDASLIAHAGEVLGIGGLAGSGRSELIRLLAGAQKASSGTIRVGGNLVKTGRVADALLAGIAYVPEERRAQGVTVSASVQDNIAIANLDAVSTAGLVSGRRIATLAQEWIDRLGIRTTGPKQLVGQLSGGNQQKIVLAKMLARAPRVLLIDEPTRGIDVGARAEIYRLIRDIADRGTAVVVVSSDLAELTGIADRILPMRGGRIVADLPGESADEAELLNLFYGRTT